uniref:Uncharacterized protein n=1 Tax=Escherichia coli TaxID=562 RepID=A0A1W5T7X0_ECOLX|nr:hypothetical protein [Escherichia coli]
MAFSGDAPATLNGKTTFPDKDGKPDMEAKSRSEGSMSRSKPPALHAVKKLLSGLKAFSVRVRV